MTGHQTRSSQTRAERKEQTRRALLDGTLHLSAERGLSNVSLREIARSADIVPTAFYRHFASIDQLGLTLVDDGMRALRVMLREARRSPGGANGQASVEILSKHVRANRQLFQFLYRERYGGSIEVRRAIDTELRFIVGELTIDLSRTPGMQGWETEDLEMAADLIVSAMQEAMVAFLSAAKSDARAEDEIVERTRKQMRLILLGIGQWRPKPRQD